jgi:hypothetical protein
MAFRLHPALRSWYVCRWRPDRGASDGATARGRGAAFHEIMIFVYFVLFDEFIFPQEINKIK